MLIDSIHKYAQSWWFRTFMFILAITFGVLWYGQDLLTVFRGNASFLASVGGTKINIQQFSQAFSQEAARIQQATGKTVPEDLYKKLTPYILERLISQTLLERETDRLGLMVTDEKLRHLITQDQNLKKTDGSFDRQKFNGFLKSVGLSEQAFLARMRQDLLTQNMLHAFLGGVKVPLSLATTLYQHQHQRRMIQLVKIEVNKIFLTEEPSAQALLDYFKKHPQQFIFPEYRDISALVFTPDHVKDRIDVTEEHLKKAYETRESALKDKSFSDVKGVLLAALEKKALKNALAQLSRQIDDALAGGASIQEIAQKHGLSVEKFVKIQNSEALSPKEIADKTPSAESLKKQIIQEAFQEKKEGATTRIVQMNEDSFFVAQVDKIYPSFPMTIDQARSKLIAYVTENLREEKAKNLAVEIENQVNRGGLLAALSAEKGLRVYQVRVTREGPLVPFAFQLPQDFINALYHLKKGGARTMGHMNEQKQKEFIVGVVEEIEPASLQGAEEEIKKFREKLKEAVFDDLVNQYLASLRRIFPVEYNQKTLKKLF